MGLICILTWWRREDLNLRPRVMSLCQVAGDDPPPPSPGLSDLGLPSHYHDAHLRSPRGSRGSVVARNCRASRSSPATGQACGMHTALSPCRSAWTVKSGRSAAICIWLSAAQDAVRRPSLTNGGLGRWHWVARPPGSGDSTIGVCPMAARGSTPYGVVCRHDYLPSSLRWLVDDSRAKVHYM